MARGSLTVFGSPPKDRHCDSRGSQREGLADDDMGISIVVWYVKIPSRDIPVPVRNNRNIRIS